MSRPIQKGDLVIMIHSGHKCADELLGIPFTVERLFYPHYGRCNCCGEYVAKEKAAAGSLAQGGIPISWLKRLDPGNLSEDVPADDEVTV